MSLIQEIFDFIRSLRLQDKLSPRRNPEIIWAYLFFPAFISYLVILTSFINEKPSIGHIVSLDASLGQLVGSSSKIEVIASGFNWTEGPLWIYDDSNPHLLFSDTVLNNIYKWEEGKGMFTIGKTMHMVNSGCRDAQFNCELRREVGTNGLLRKDDSSLDLIAASHGERSLMLLRDNGTRSALVSHYKGKLLNSPNDLVWSPDGHLYFTDPHYGLFDHNRQLVDKQLDHNGVYMVKSDYVRLALQVGEPTAYVRLLEGKMAFPNGLAFSPDYSKLYIANSDPADPYINVYNVADDGSLLGGKVFFNASSLYQAACKEAQEALLPCEGHVGVPDGLKVDIDGNVYATGPGGVMILSPEGKHLGTLKLDRPASNVAFGGDGRLYITAKDLLLRVKVKSKPSRIIRK
eukprot:gene38243-46471_t